MSKFRRWVMVMVAAMLVSTLFVPSYAYAQLPDPLSIEQCNENLDLDLQFESWEFSSKVVACLKYTVVERMVDFLDALSKYMTWIVAVLVTFALMAFSLKLMGGEESLQPKTLGFIVRLAIVVMFFYNLGGFGQVMFDVMDQLVCLVSIPETGNLKSEQVNVPGILPQGDVDMPNFAGQVLKDCYPWNFIDKFVGKMMGFGEHLVLSNGLIGLIVGALFSSTLGWMLFFVGLMAFLEVIFTIIRVIFVYLSAVIVVAFMIVISPFVIPTALFVTQERFFKRWLDTLLAAVITPMLLFAFVGMFLGMYDILIDRIYDILGGFDSQGVAHLEAYWRTNQPQSSWMLATDPNLAQDFEDIARSENPGRPAVPTFINPYLRRAMEVAAVNLPGVHFGEATVKIMQQLVLAFASLWLFSTMMKSMIRKIPEVAQGIAGATLGIGYQSSSFEAGIRSAVGKARQGLGG